MRLGDLLRPRLALHIYLVGLAQMVVVAAGFVAILYASRPELRGPLEVQARGVADEIAPTLDDPASLAQRLRAHTDVSVVTVISPDGSVIASTSPEAPRCTRRLRDRPPPLGGGPPPPLEDGPWPAPFDGPHGWGGPGGPGGPGDRGPHGEPPGPGPCAIVPLSFSTGDGQLHYFGEPPPEPPSLGLRVIPLVLLVVGVSSFLLARWLLRPLEKLSKTARALGAGDLGARTGLARRDELGDVARAFDDMAERVNQLLRAEKELIANVSHELRTPLSRIRVALDIAAEGDAETARESLAEIAADLDELERLIEDVLTAARLDLQEAGPSSGIPPLRIARFDARELVDEAAGRFRAAHPKRPLDVHAEEGLPTIEGDRVLLRRVVDNLLENAHKYTEAPGSPIELRAHFDDDLVIEVVDRGMGIAEADLPNVFRPFFRADKSRTRATGGLGLGLALAKRIADAHGGALRLESTPGVGTRARLTLPVRRGQPG